MTRLRRLLVVVAVVVAGCSGGGHNAAESDGPAAVPTVLVLDASGSMNEADAPGSRIDAAKRAAQGLIEGLPDGTATALLAYGTATGSSEDEKGAGCQDVKVLIGMGPLNRNQMATEIEGLRASGYTPISLALRTAVSQLPAGDEPQAIILVSDGEDTCGATPCDTAKEAVQKYPNIAISTVGFKTEGNASDQLRCIAEATGGLFVVAQNANQLAARLLATQDVEQAQSSLSSNGIGDIMLGARLGDIRKAHTDFPDASASGSVVVVYRDCDYTFVDGVLDSIAPHGGGRTIDGVSSGTQLSRAIELYGNAVTTETDGSGGYRLTFTADPATGSGYRVTVDDYADSGGTISGTIKTIALCRCTPHFAPPAAVTENTIRNMTFPVGACGSPSSGWHNTVPITLRDGEGEATLPSGEFGGASIVNPSLEGRIDAEGNGTQDAVVSFRCFGSTIAHCCAGRSSSMIFIGVFDFSDGASPRPIGDIIVPGSARFIDEIQIDGSTIVTREKLIYPEHTSAAEIGYPPYATVEVTHRFTDRRWTSTERVIG